jgi:hypothetical protein
MSIRFMCNSIERFRVVTNCIQVDTVVHSNRMEWTQNVRYIVILLIIGNEYSLISSVLLLC